MCGLLSIKNYVYDVVFVINAHLSRTVGPLKQD